MTGFERGSSAIGSDRNVNSATATALTSTNFAIVLKDDRIESEESVWCKNDSPSVFIILWQK